MELRADCSRCFGLCCVVPAFAASSEFAIDKPPNHPCPNLHGDFSCRIHVELRPRGFAGCTVYDCFGAGQHVAQETFQGRSWREAPDTAPRMFATFTVMRHLHELLWYLTEAHRLRPPSALDAEVTAARDGIADLTTGGPDELLALDVGVLRDGAGDLLRRVSDAVRGRYAPAGADHRGADLIGADLRRARLRGANLRGAYLIGADLRGVDLSWADVTGADLRGARLAGADLDESVFLLQSQLDSATGDATTTLPPDRHQPTHW